MYFKNDSIILENTDIYLCVSVCVRERNGIYFGSGYVRTPCAWLDWLRISCWCNYIPRHLFKQNENIRQPKKLTSMLTTVLWKETSNWKYFRKPSVKMGKETVVCSYSGTSLSNKKGWTTNIHSHLDESQKHFADWKNLDTQIYTYIFINMYV